jgi:hypothetical protein
MILMDSNIIIYVTSGQYPGLTSWFLDNAPSASVMSKVDVLGYHNLKSTEKAELERFFSRLNVIYPTAEEFERAIELRQRHGITDWHSPRTTKKISSGSSHSKSLTQCRDKRNRHPNSWRIRVSCKLRCIVAYLDSIPLSWDLRQARLVSQGDDVAAGAVVETQAVETRVRERRGVVMTNLQANNPLHGITLEMMLEQLVKQYGWAELGNRIPIKCFTDNPSIKSSLKFLRQTP